MKIVETDHGVGMSESELRNFLSNSKLNLQLGTTDETGFPSIHPVWYVFENDKLYIETGRATRKAGNIMRSGRVYFSIDDERVPYKGVKGKGQAAILSDKNQCVPLIGKIMVKHVGSPSHPLAKQILQDARNGSEVVIEITSFYYATWDHSRLRLQPK